MMDCNSAFLFNMFYVNLLLCFVLYYLKFQKTIVSTAVLEFLTLNARGSDNKFDIFLFSEYHRNAIMDFYRNNYLIVLILFAIGANENAQICFVHTF